MLILFDQDLDLSFIFFFLFFIFIFLFFFIVCMFDKQYLKIRLKFADILDKGKVTNDIFILHHAILQFFIFNCFINILTFYVCFVFLGEFFFFPSGSLFYINLSFLSTVFPLNFFLILYLLIFKVWFKKINHKLYMFFFKSDEFLLFSLLHLLSFFIFGCKDFVSFFISLEILSFLFFIHTAFYGTIKSLNIAMKYALNIRIMEASLKYLIPGLFSSLLLLLGICILYFITGILNLNDFFIFFTIWTGLWTWMFSFNFFFLLVIFLGLLFIFCSFCFKLSIVPFHTWVLWVYEGTLQHIVFLLSSVSKYFYFLIFVKSLCSLYFLFDQFSFLMLVLGLCSIFLGTFFGLFELRFNSILAFSGILNMGYCFIALSLYTTQGLLIAIFSLFIYSFLSLMLFSFLVRIPSFNKGSFLQTISDFKIFAVFNSNVCLFLIIIIFSIIGIPPLPGFYPKILLFLNLFLYKNWIVSVLLLLAVIVSSFFYLRWISYLNVGITLNNIKLWFTHYYSTTNYFLWFFSLLFFLFVSTFFILDLLFAYFETVLEY